MRRELGGARPALRRPARGRPAYGLAVGALAALAVSVAGCGSSSGTSGSAAGGTSAPARQPSSVSPGDSLALSHMRILTKLTDAELCGILPASEAATILHAATQAPVYTDRPGVAISCQWTRRGASRLSGKQLYVAVSALINWTGAQAVDTPLRGRPVTIDGHPGLAVGRRAQVRWAEVDVALGGDHDPVAQFRAPTMAIALGLARAATPHLIAMG
jgi:Protein of unknown function (DUF3558)